MFKVLTWAKQHHQRLAVALDDLITKKELLESLLTWLQWAEATLNEKDKEDIPEEIDEVKALIAEHQVIYISFPKSCKRTNDFLLHSSMLILCHVFT